MSKNKNSDSKDTFYNGMMMERNAWIQTQNENELEKCGGVKTYRKDSSEFRRMVTVVPVELEIPWELDNFVKAEILDTFDLTYPKWIQKCYVQRMKQILSDPAEFGKAVLESKKRDHCIQDVHDWEDC